MGKFREKNYKPKRQPQADFTKKKAKVGRKVKSSNVTSIKVQAKRIQVPLQAQVTAGKPGNEKDTLNALLRSLQHYSGPTRTLALEELGEFMRTSRQADTYICLVFPPALELLFDEERDTRKALLVLLSGVLSRHPTASFLSVLPVAITYVCSGLTNLSKSVRRDALTLLLALANSHAALLAPHLVRLVEHVLALLADPAQASGQDSLGASAAQGAVIVAGGGTLARAKANLKLEQGSGHKRRADGGAVAAAGAGAGAGAGSAGLVTSAGTAAGALQRPPLLVAVLEVLEAVLSTSGGSSGSSSSRCSGDGGGDSAAPGPAHTVLVRPLGRTCKWLDQAAYGAAPPSASATAASNGDGLAGAARGPLPAALTAALCRRLEIIWRGLVLDSPRLPAHNMRVLALIAKVRPSPFSATSLSQLSPSSALLTTLYSFLYKTRHRQVAGCLGSRFAATALPAYVSAVAALFSRFPHVAVEAATGSGDAARAATLQVTPRPRPSRAPRLALDSLIHMQPLRMPPVPDPRGNDR
jgi:hypothetical protein